MNIKINLILCIAMHPYIHTAGLLPVPFGPHRSFASDTTSTHSSSPSDSELLNAVKDSTLQTVETPESSPRIDLGGTPPGFSEKEINLRREVINERKKDAPGDKKKELQESTDTLELAPIDRELEGWEEQQLKARLEKERKAQLAKELRKYADEMKPVIAVSQTLQKLRSKSEEFAGQSPVGSASMPSVSSVTSSQSSQKARSDSEDYTHPSPGGSASMSPASSVTSSYSSAISSASTSPQQSPLFAAKGSPQKGSPSPKSSPLHKGAGAPPYAAPPPIPGRTTNSPERENLFRKHLQYGTSSRTLVSAALATLSPKSLPPKESGKKSDG